MRLIPPPWMRVAAFSALLAGWLTPASAQKVNVSGTASSGAAPKTDEQSPRARSGSNRSDAARISIPPLEVLGDQLRKAFPPKRAGATPTAAGGKAAKSSSPAQAKANAKPQAVTHGTATAAGAANEKEGAEAKASEETSAAPEEANAVEPARAGETRDYPVVEKRVRRDTPMSDQARTIFGQAAGAFARGEFKEARTLFQEAAKLAPGHPVVLTNLALAEYRAGDAVAAENHLREAVANDLNAVDAWLTLGILCVELDKLDGAVAALTQCTLLEPHDARSRNHLGVAYSRLGWYDAAEAQLQRAIELKEDYEEGHFNLAVVYLRREPIAIELARRHYQRALDLGAAPDELIEKMLAGGKSQTVVKGRQ